MNSSSDESVATTSSTRVSLSSDDFVRELEEDRGQAIWLAHLSDGSTVYQDDGRPGASPPSAWLRLQTFLLERPDLRILGFSLRFRDNFHRMVVGASPTYFFRKAISAVVGSSERADFILIGTIENAIIKLTRWKVPELILMGVEERPVPESGEGLLLNNP
jgi:hypothetical protein